MCGIWTQDQWKDAANDKRSGYSLLGEYQNENGERALMMKNAYGTITNVYDVRGVDTQDFRKRRGEAGEDYLGRAKQAMTRQGFSPIVAAPESVRVPGIAELAVTKANQQANLAQQGSNGEGRVQGRTIAEWKKIGEENEGKSEHVHPDFPEGYNPTSTELEAYAASLTGEEAIMALLATAGI